MHKLDRTIAPAPACLAGYQHGTHTWNDLTPTDRQQIRASLQQMQDVRCAYCEGPVYSDGHIEHFRRKNPAHFPELTFVWSNLFLSCGSQEHCGHYKDRPSAPPYDPNTLVKPDEHEPDHHFFFHSSGQVRVRSGIAPERQARALETIRVFHLDCGALTAARRRAIEQYERREAGILETLMLFDELERQQFIEAEIQATCAEPHWTVIRHYFEKAQ